MKNCVLALIFSAITFATAAHSQSSYAGEQSRAIKALSQAEIDGYLQGHGMGYAKAAELNHYPGPRHVLVLANELGLTAVQVDQTQAIFERMQTVAVALGKQLVEKEAELDRKLANRTIDEITLGALVTDIAMIESKFRTVHLRAHLEQKALLSDEQVRLYDTLRGYIVTDGQDHRHGE